MQILHTMQSLHNMHILPILHSLHSKIIRIFGPKMAISAPKYAFLGTYKPCRLIWCAVGWLFGGLVRGLYLARHLFTLLWYLSTPHTKINCYWWRLLLMIVIGCFSTEGSFLGGGSLWPQWSNVHFLLSAPWLITSDVLCILCLSLHCYVSVFVYLIKCVVPTVLTMIDHQVVGDGGCNPSNGHLRPI